jgi:hypothetical protein
METRKITIVSTRAQKKYVLETAATTLAELKEAMDAQDIDYSGMTFFEGLTKTELKVDDSQLPHDVEYKGNITNELVIMLTVANKNIKSGNDRADCYDFIKRNNLQQKVKEVYGKNYTNVSTEELLEFAEGYPNEPSAENKASNEGDYNAENVDVDCVSRKAIVKLVQLLEDYELIEPSDAEDIYALISKPSTDIKLNNEVKSPYADDEIESMFEGLR